MAVLNIVLVEPQIPQNTGNISRTCAVTGARLHLVGPMGFVITDRQLKRAGLDYWDLLDVTIYSDLDDFFPATKALFSTLPPRRSIDTPTLTTPMVPISSSGERIAVCRKNCCLNTNLTVCGCRCFGILMPAV